MEELSAKYDKLKEKYNRLMHMFTETNLKMQSVAVGAQKTAPLPLLETVSKNTMF